MMPSNAMACVVSSTERNCIAKHINNIIRLPEFPEAFMWRSTKLAPPLWMKTDLQKGKILVLVDLNSKDWVAWGLSQATQTHLSIEEVHHRLLYKYIYQKAKKQSIQQKNLVYRWKPKLYWIHENVEGKILKPSTTTKYYWMSTIKMYLTSVIPNGMLPT